MNIEFYLKSHYFQTSSVSVCYGSRTTFNGFSILSIGFLLPTVSCNSASLGCLQNDELVDAEALE